MLFYDKPEKCVTLVLANPNYAVTHRAADMTASIRLITCINFEYFNIFIVPFQGKTRKDES